ncbi:hypothetical protein EV177_003912 [Coemansia sp. RSA 1804]|nr:hypothetical protein EV177_003912 [Coemansia sp. RSA 1804]
MAPILLKIKGTKLFSPFNEIEDVGDLSTLWRVCTKVKDSLENGSRLENLSWRLWHLHQTLEARGKGRDYRKLSPATTKQLEKTIRRPEYMKNPKPMQIKVRLGKSSERPAEASRGSGNDYDERHRARLEKQGSLGSKGNTAITGGAGVSAAALTPMQSAASESTEAPAGSALGNTAGPDNGDDAGAGGVVSSALSADNPSATKDHGAFMPSSNTDASTNMLDKAQMGGENSAGLVGGTTNTGTTAVAAEQSGASQAVGVSEEVQASDFMSFGPSSFLSSGFDLDAPQIEITLDDIFSANSNDWSQFGFASMTNGPVLGMPMADYSGGQGMWNNMQYHGPMPMATPYGMPSHMHMSHPEQPEKHHDGPICANCGVTSTPLWRRSIDDTLLCNACGLYYKLHNTHRPKSLRSNASRKEGMDEDIPKTVCTNCKTTTTPLWRRDESGNALCNACGLYYKLHKENRPITLKSDVIRKRQRHDPTSAAPRKRQQSRSISKQTATAAATQTADATESSSSASSASPTPAASATTPKSAKAAGSSRSGKGKTKSTAPPEPDLVHLSELHKNTQPIPATDGDSGDVPMALATPFSHDPNTPQSAPPVSYSANGMQLLNRSDTQTSIEHTYQSYVHGSNTGHGLEHSTSLQHPGDSYSVARTDVDYKDVSNPQFGIAEITAANDRPPPLQYSATLPIHRFDGTGSGQQVSFGSSNGNSNSNSKSISNSNTVPRTSSGSINIPMSPPLSARPSSYFNRPSGTLNRPATVHDQTGTSAAIQASLPSFPSLGSSVHSGSQRYDSGSGGVGGVGLLHTTASLQPMGGGNSGSRQTAAGAPHYSQQQQSSLLNHHPSSPIHAGHGHSQGVPLTATSTATTSEPKHQAERQLPSLAELATASSTHNSDSFRYARQQQQQQPRGAQYQSLNP